MKVYVAGALADVERVRGVQAAVVGVGHELTLDWTLGPDASLVDYALAPEVAGRLASDDLVAVEGGPDAANQAGTKLVLKPISQADDKAEGGAHSAMVRTCEVESAVGAPGGQASGGDGFLVIPVPWVGVPSFFICGGPSSGGGGGGGAQ